jgi:hypothetical protein
MEQPTQPPELEPSFDISDAAHNSGNEHFFFLPPMVAQPPAFNGAFDATVAPVVQICDWNGTSCVTPILAEFTMTTGPGSETVRLAEAEEHYIVNWHTDEFGLDTSKTYRIQVIVSDQTMGYGDVDLVEGGKQLKDVNTDLYIPLKDGRTLPIKFRIEEGALAPPCLTPPSGLVSWWPGDGNANDIAGGNNGTLHNGAAFALGMVGRAFSFDGVDDAFTAPTVGLPTGNSDRTLMFWVKSPNMAVGNRMMAGWGSAANGKMSSITIGRYNLPSRVPFFWGYNADVVASSTLDDDVWYHLAATIHGGGYVKFYINGSPAGANANAYPFDTPSGTTFYMADFYSIMTRNFNVILDEVQVYDVALTEHQISSAFDAGADGMCKD